MKNLRNYYIIIPIIIVIGVMFLRDCSKKETPATEVLKNSALLDLKKSSPSNLLVNANFSTIQKDSIKAYGLCWSLDVNPTIIDSIFKQEGSKNSFSLNIAPFLKAGTQYYARAFVVNLSDIVIYSPIVPIVTPSLETKVSANSAAPKAPMHPVVGLVSKPAAIKPLTTVGIISGYDTFQSETSFSVVFDSIFVKEAITKGICYGDNPNPTINYNRVVDTNSDNKFKGTISNLTPNKTYYYRSYIVTKKDTFYGKSQEFKTLKIDVPVVGDVNLTLIKGKSMFVSNSVVRDGGTAVSERGVCWSMEKNPTIDDAHAIDSLAGGIGRSGAKVVGLNKDVPYYLRSYAVNSVGIGYGAVAQIYSQVGQVGDEYGGGIIFYLDETGRHGAVCAPVDQTVGIHWVGAILLCKQLKLNGYSDWMLPTKEELDLMYSNLYLNNIGSLSNYYWSSSENDYNDAWYWRMNYGSPYYNYKGNVLNVRAVRHF